MKKYFTISYSVTIINAISVDFTTDDDIDAVVADSTNTYNTPVVNATIATVTSKSPGCLSRSLMILYPGKTIVACKDRQHQQERIGPEEKPTDKSRADHYAQEIEKPRPQFPVSPNSFIK
ncbi:MAG: hypothetical protein WDO15_01985 [Bacteroidota bacterium]